MRDSPLQHADGCGQGFSTGRNHPPRRPIRVCECEAPISDPEIFTLQVPVLEICQDMQLMACQPEGSVEKAERGKYGPAAIDMDNPSYLLQDIKEEGVGVD